MALNILSASDEDRYISPKPDIRENLSCRDVTSRYSLMKLKRTQTITSGASNVHSYRDESISYILLVLLRFKYNVSRRIGTNELEIQRRLKQVFGQLL